MPRVSIIMGVYNCKNDELLEKSIESIINQTFQDWEFLICNDGSTDNTLEKLNKLSERDKRIRILSYQNNKGLAGALNFCIDYSCGEYIARQDYDDFSIHTRIEEQVSFLDNHPEYAIVGTIADVYDDHGIWGEYLIEEIPSERSFLWNSPFLHPSVVMRKDALNAAGNYRIAKETRKCEDYDLFMRMYSKGFKGYNIQEKLLQYRIVIDNEKYRPMKYRIDEAKVRVIGYKQLGLLPGALPFVIKPVLIGLLPQRIFKLIRKSQYN